MPKPRVRSAWRRARIKLRWAWRRAERRLPDWARRTLPWGASLLAHALVLFLMAVVIKFVQGHDTSAQTLNEVNGQLLDDVTSASPADRAGDPFTRLDNGEPPSLPRDLTQIDDTVIAVAELPPDVRIGPELDLTPDPIVDRADGAGGGIGIARSSPGMSAPFRGRSQVERARLVRREGGTVESEAAVERGLDWLARHQRPDGSWSLAASETCSDPPCPERPAMESDVAATGLALLPLLGAGHTHVAKGRYQQTIRRGLAWLMKQQQPDGLIYTGGAFNAQMYSHAIATMALCEAYGLTKDAGLRPSAQRAVAYIIRAQHVLGGWRYAPMREGDTSVHGWMIFALRSADLAGIAIPRRTITQAKRYLDNAAADKSKATYAYQPGRGMTPVMTAEALVCRQILGWPRDFPALNQGVALVAQHLAQFPDERNIYYWYYATQLLHNMRGKDWPTWNETMREALIATQVKGNGCARGSWDPLRPVPDAWGDRAGRLYTTSLSLLTLEVYYRYLPLYRDQGGEIAGSDTEPSADEPKPDADETDKPDDAGLANARASRPAEDGDGGR
jgi:hypothetical protein